MNIKSTKPNRLLSEIPSNPKTPSIAVDLESIGVRQAVNAANNPSTLGVLGADLVEAYKDFDPSVQFVGDIYKHAGKYLMQDFSDGTDFVVQGGLLTWKTAGLAAEFTKDEPDYVKVAVGGAGALADAAVLLSATGMWKVNPVLPALFSLGCTVFLRYHKRDRERLKAAEERLGARTDPKIAAAERAAQFKGGAPEPEFCRIDMEPKDVGKVASCAAGAGLGLIGLAALGKAPRGRKALHAPNSIGLSRPQLYLSPEPLMAVSSARPANSGTARLRKPGGNAPISSAKTSELRRHLMTAAHRSAPTNEVPKE